MEKAQKAYEGFVRFLGDASPWDALSPRTRNAWRVAVLAADGYEAAVKATASEQEIERLKTDPDR